MEAAESFFATARNVLFKRTSESANVWMGPPKMQPNFVNIRI
jgi:hypothetical protein